jgi:tetratricopeptide (TPR) repeat protein
MKKKDSPDISEKFQKVYQKFFEIGGEPKKAIKIIDKFLENEPYYPEALIFKARMLLALGKNNKAIETIELAEKYDKWRLLGKFDKAEAFLEKGETEQSITEFINAIQSYQNELQNGIEAYLSSLAKPKDSENIKEKVFECLSSTWCNNEKSGKQIANLEKYLKKNKNKFKPLK